VQAPAVQNVVLAPVNNDLKRKEKQIEKNMTVMIDIINYQQTKTFDGQLQ
jgi:hypothetical protein